VKAQPVVRRHAMAGKKKDKKDKKGK